MSLESQDELAGRIFGGVELRVIFQLENINFFIKYLSNAIPFFRYFLQISKTDKHATILDIHFNDVVDFARFHETCDATNVQVRISVGIRNENGVTSADIIAAPTVTSTSIKKERESPPYYEEKLSELVKSPPVGYISLLENESDVESIKRKNLKAKAHSKNSPTKMKSKMNGKTNCKRTKRAFPIECFRGYCAEVFDSWRAMLYHALWYHAKTVKNAFQCHLCRKIFSTKQQLRKHMDTVHSCHIRFQCPMRECAKIFTQKSNLTTHINALHTKYNAFNCFKCPMKFYRRDSLRHHLASKHGEGHSFCCSLCSLTFARKQSLQRHFNAKHPNQSSIEGSIVMQRNDRLANGDSYHSMRTVYNKEPVIDLCFEDWNTLWS